MFTVVTAAVVVVLVAKKVVAWAEAVIAPTVEGKVIDARIKLPIIKLAVVAIPLEFAMAVPYSVGVVVGMLIDAVLRWFGVR